MSTAKDVLDQYFLEIRWRVLSLAADLDRVGRAAGGKEVLGDDPRVAKLRQAIAVLLKDSPDRAAQVQLIFSDMTPPPSK